MKKEQITASLLALGMILALLSGCGRPEQPAQTPAAQTPDQPAPAAAENPPEDAAEDAGVETVEVIDDDSEPVAVLDEDDVSSEAGAEWSPATEFLGSENLQAYEKAASALGLDTWSAAKQYCSALLELGDGAGWTETELVKGEGGAYDLYAARLRQFCFDDDLPALAEKVASQYERFRSGNRDVLGPGDRKNDEELFYSLTGLTVFHPALTGARLQVTANGIDCGEFALADGEACTLIPLELPEFVADSPVHIELRLANAPADAEIQVYPGLDSNVSRGI